MSFLGLYRDPVVAKVTDRCDWRIADLIAQPQPVSLYFVVPPSELLHRPNFPDAGSCPESTRPSQRTMRLSASHPSWMLRSVWPPSSQSATRTRCGELAKRRKCAAPCPTLNSPSPSQSLRSSPPAP